MVNCSEAIGPFIYLFEFITRRIELNKTMKKNIAFYYLSDAIDLFFFWFIIRRIALDKTMNKKENTAFYYLSDTTMKKKESIAFYYLKYIKGH